MQTLPSGQNVTGSTHCLPLAQAPPLAQTAWQAVKDLYKPGVLYWVDSIHVPLMQSYSFES